MPLTQSPRPLHNKAMFDVLRPNRIARRLTDIDLITLEDRGIQGILLDLDNTLTPWRSRVVSSETQIWVTEARMAGLRLCIVTNAASHARVKPVADELDLPYVVRAVKPLAHGFHAAMHLLNTTPATTAAIGDQVFTDIFGANRLGIYTILVEPLSEHEALVTKLLQRPLERIIGREAKPKSAGITPPKNR